MARLIDLDKIKPIYFPSTEMDGLDVVRYLNTLPTVDAVPVVRCKDCKHYEDCDHGSGKICYRWDEWIYPNEDDFCSLGERKNDV